MSQFDRYTRTEYVEGLRQFLGKSKKDFLRNAGFVDEDAVRQKGRLKRYADEPIAALEEEVNQKSARAEAPDATLGERYRLARDFKGLKDSEVARSLGVSRELARRWGRDIHVPTCMPELAELLEVPEAWLWEGGEHNLPANSPMGVRVGVESREWREKLYSLTLDVVAKLPENADEDYARAYLEWAVYNTPEMAQAARRAGGRWQILNGALLFAPWVPIPPHGLSRKMWSDEVEAIIQEELATKPTVYGAYESLKKRCEALGIPSNQYPARISLHKRVEKEQKRIEQFGIDLNDLVNESVRHCAENTSEGATA